MNSQALTHQFQLAANDLGVRTFRNNVGQGWVGKAEVIRCEKTTTVRPGDVIVRSARPLHAGLAPGSADLIGIHIQSGRFISAEVKAGRDRMRPDQIRWQEFVTESGGIAVVVRDVQQAVEDIRRQLPK